MMSYKLIVAALFAMQAQAATIRVDVGSSGKTFSPSTVTANIGDLVEFHFGGSEHSVVMSDFSNPCKPAAAGGFYSGFPSNSIFRVNVTTTDPIFYYCSKGSHCSGGMVGAINPTEEQSLSAFRSSASGNSASTPKARFGGEIVPSGAGAMTVSLASMVGAIGVALLMA